MSMNRLKCSLKICENGKTEMKKRPGQKSRIVDEKAACNTVSSWYRAVSENKYWKLWK